MSKVMTTEEFLHQKNAIVEKVTGIILIPVDQITNSPKVKLREDTAELMNIICPYCITYKSTTPFDCGECPMSLVDNNCAENNTSTWRMANRSWKINATDIDKTKLIELVKEYNKENL